MSQARIERMLSDVRITNPGKLAVLTIAAVAGAVIAAIITMTSVETQTVETAPLPVKIGATDFAD